jgi:hypothetical protein
VVGLIVVIVVCLVGIGAITLREHQLSKAKADNSYDQPRSFHRFGRGGGSLTVAGGGVPAAVIVAPGDSLVIPPTVSPTVTEWRLSADWGNRDHTPSLLICLSRPVTSGRDDFVGTFAQCCLSKSQDVWCFPPPIPYNPNFSGWIVAFPHDVPGSIEWPPSPGEYVMWWQSDVLSGGFAHESFTIHSDHKVTLGTRTSPWPF